MTTQIKKDSEATELHKLGAQQLQRQQAMLQKRANMVNAMTLNLDDFS